MKGVQNLIALLAIASIPAVAAAPVPADQLVGRDAEPKAEPDYGKYGNYGDYAPPAGGYGKYSTYGSYKREAEPQPADYGKYGKYGKYGNYGDYAPPAGGYGKYSTYGSYKRTVDFVKRLWS
jgi:hypothetical protein